MALTSTRRRTVRACATGLVAGLALASPVRALAQASDEPTASENHPRPVRFVFDGRPAIEIERSIRVELGLRLDAAVRLDDPPAGDERFGWTGRRAEIAGRVTDRIAFEVSRDLGGDEQWRDVFADVKAASAVSFRGGRFKVPFSDERLRGLGSIDFVERSYAAEQLAPGRRNGGMGHGETWKNRLDYAVGVFQSGDDETLDDDPIQRGHDRPLLAATRVTIRPFAALPEANALRTLRLGVAGFRDSVLPGLATLGVSTRDGGESMFSPVYVNGPRSGVGTELRWTPAARLRIYAEWMQVRTSRHAQALDGGDLPALAGQGWYASAIYRVAQSRGSGGWITRWLFRELEVGGRFEGIRFGTGPGTVDVIHPRTAVVPWHSLHALTLGATWRLNRYSRIQINAVAEDPDTPAAAAVDNHRHWSSAVKLQVQF